MLTLPGTLGTTGDAELVRLAQAGDVSSLGLVLARHRASMMAVALSMLRRPAEAEDAVQDAMLLALSRIGDLRDPAAVGPWLKMVVRNCCRTQLRARTPLPVDELDDPPLWGKSEDDPQALLERHASRDWVWHSLEQLSLPLRTVTMLRYFTQVTSYEQIAAVCGVPVGTVRSRLNKARAVLSTQLLATRHTAHDDMAMLTAARRREAEDAVEAGHRGTFGEILRASWDPGVDVAWADGRRMRGITPVVEVIDRSMAAGVRQRVVGVVASRDVVIWEIDVLKPPGGPPLCPPHACWLLFLDAGRVRQLRLFHRLGSDV
jgi:RNA polymerase sigma-70 factor (ECF subfamily)